MRTPVDSDVWSPTWGFTESKTHGPIVPLFDKYESNASCVPGLGLDARNTIENKTEPWSS